MDINELIECYRQKIYVNVHIQNRRESIEYFLKHDAKLLCISHTKNSGYHLSYDHKRVDFDNQHILNEFYLLIKKICLLNLKFLRIKNDLKFELGKSLMGSDLPNRFEEFEVIKNQSIDLISLNSLFDYYNIPFDPTRYQ